MGLGNVAVELLGLAKALAAAVVRAVHKDCLVRHGRVRAGSRQPRQILQRRGQRR